MYRVAILFTDKTTTSCWACTRTPEDAYKALPDIIKRCLSFHNDKDVLLIQIVKDAESLIWDNDF